SLFTLADFSLPTQPRMQSTLTTQYRRAWRFQVPGASAYNVVPKSAPLLIEDRLYLGADNGSFWALNVTNGDPVWKFQTEGSHRKGIWSSPACHAGRIYFGAYNGTVYCLEAASGREIWRQPACEWVGSSPLIVPCHELLVI